MQYLVALAVVDASLHVAQHNGTVEVLEEADQKAKWLRARNLCAHEHSGAQALHTEVVKLPHLSGLLEA